MPLPPPQPITTEHPPRFAIAAVANLEGLRALQEHHATACLLFYSTTPLERPEGILDLSCWGASPVDFQIALLRHMARAVARVTNTETVRHHVQTVLGSVEAEVTRGH